MRSEDKYALSGRLQRVISTMSYLANFFKKSAQPQRYKLLAHLTAYSGSLHALAISNDGHILAGGGKRVGTQPWTALITKPGTEGIKLWDIKSRKELTSSSHHHESRGTVSCGVWAMTRKATVETLCYGTGLGYIIFLRRSLIDVSAQACRSTFH